MTFQPIANELQNKVRAAVQDSARICQHAAILSKELKQAFDHPYPKEHWGVDFQIKEGSSDASLSTPFGIARTKLYVMVNENGVYGRYVIEKRFEKRNDEEAWMPVWEIRITEDGKAFAGDSKEKPADLLGVFKERLGQQISELALSMLYAIGNAEI